MLREIMKEKGVSIRQLAKTAGISTTTVQRVLKDPLLASGDALRKIAEALDLDVEVNFKER